MGIQNLLGLAQSGLLAYSYAIDLTGQNVTNANTPDYARRSALLAGRPHGGVDVLGTQRAVDRFAEARYFSTAGFAAGANARSAHLADVEALMNDVGGTGLSDSIGAMFGSFQRLSQNPGDPVVRAEVLSRADAFATRVRGVAAGIATKRADLLEQARGIASEITGLAHDIAGLNAQIATTEGSGGDASSLRDRRDHLVASLSERVDTQVITDGNGKLVVRGGGTTLVEGDIAATLTVQASPTGAMQILASADGSPPGDITSTVGGGTLGAAKTVREDDLVKLAASLDALATDIASAINTQHQAGYGLDGVGRRDLFSFTPGAGAAWSLALDANMAGRPERVAAASAPTALAGDGGNAQLLSALSSAKIAGGGSRTALESYSDVVYSVGAMARDASSEADLRTSLFAQAKAMKESTSGVNMDEEMISLTKYQRAYEASSKLLRTADDLLAGLMRDL